MWYHIFLILASYSTTRPCPQSGYEIPTSIQYTWQGSSSDGTPISIKLSQELTNLRGTIDILSELPYLVKILVQTFVSSVSI